MTGNSKTSIGCASHKKSNELATSASGVTKPPAFLTAAMQTAIPRPGGYIKILDPKAQGSSAGNKDSFECQCKPACEDLSRCRNISTTSLGGTRKSATRVSSHDTTRNYRINKVIEENDWDRCDDQEGEDDDDDNLAKSRVPDRVPLNLLAILISTIMLMASGKNVPDEYIDSTIAYLDCITDDENRVPPNVQKLLNHLSKNYADRMMKRSKDMGNVQVLTAKKATRQDKNKLSVSKTYQ